ncbi:hydantoinase B/oxoprolinase family protein [Verminephrobacter eiseniae]|uniref:Hydantoinase B/oxoprolinase n=1 Tax=Verminephrobacter eiseniae (strain EF01-2) TaxID=391735 RepID=A1WIY0_VEREI|nr:hydantoinase B/oxoprolinase family protein [Verminephrobacter eiseniae]ABM57587.1 Hydantoinase B/oxoprolinase [Verminephrobacter eiseniae EF01-2]MCW5283208.1 acetone carboxylase subunit alpha [Verminephrobacter eiseniae]MCW5303524.1 acetone carboxylase subunit alpha [Verminephrobacter eiseniae]MCW8179751.1 acetone carboxylase subunit alpha [Verminephrobacter eiseniae]MCW8188318.1 acetone carboxylase subunit alpha [Verminephrobacter eiseniae]
MKNDLNPDEREAFESVEAFLKNQTVFIGPDPDIMRDHGLAPRTPREHALLARDWERDRVGLMRDRLISNCNETWQVMSAIASSPGAKWGDSITGIWTASGDLAVVSTGGVLGFASITHYALRHIMKYWRGEPSIGVNDGDAFMHNDARWGSIHPADFATFMPVFAGGELACWVGCSEHLGENGAIEPGGLSALAESVYGEGLRISPMKIAEGGELKRDLVTFMQNMVRDRALMYEDMKARLAVCKTLVQRVHDAIAEFGADDFIGMLRLGLEDVQAEVRRRIAALPDGTTRAIAFADSTLREQAYIKCNVELRKSGERLVVNVRGSAPEFANRTINSVLGSTKAVVGNLLCGFVWPDLPRNQAVLAPVEFEVDPGSCLNSSFETPNSISMLTLFPTFTALQVAFTKLSYAAPQARTRALAPWYNMINTYIYAGVNQRGQMVASISANVNGMPGGARDGADGEHSIAALFSIMGDLPEIEVQEQEVPYLSLIGKKLLRDNQGFGKFRGGSGFQWAISPKDSPLWGFATVASGSAYPNISGIFGGYGCGTYPICKVLGVDIFERIEDDPRAFASYDLAEIMNQRPIAGARYETHTMAMPFELAQRGDIYLMSQGTGGGWGDVLEREPLSVWRDVCDQILCAAVARQVYGVVLHAQTQALDEDATQRVRAQLRAERLARGRPYAEFIADWVTPGPSGLPAPYFGCWDKPDEIWMGNEEVPSPADALQPVMMQDPQWLRIRELEAQVRQLRAERTA